MEIISERNNLKKQHEELSLILNNPKQLHSVIKKEIKNIQQKFGITTALGKRRTDFEEIDISNAQVIDISAFIEKEAVTVICSKMGWIRSIKGHNVDLSNNKYKEGDEERFIIETYTTDKILVCSESGKFFTILVDNIFNAKGNGASRKLRIDSGNDEIAKILIYKPNQKILLASNNSKGFIVNSDELIAQTKNGKQVMQVLETQSVICCNPVEGDVVACIGENRKLLIFNIDEIPEMKRGQGVILQKFKDAKLSDIKIFNSQNGLSWNLGEKVRLEKEILPWRGKRGAAGKIPPVGFPKNNKFS
jgi:topoisomerase-4 subunit A